jgi:hypothetical protein
MNFHKRKKHTRLFKVLFLLIGVVFPLWLTLFIYSQFFEVDTDEAHRLNNAVNQRNYEFARGNSFGFTDRERMSDKPPHIFRIAVLGDSYIWGDGMPYQKIWSHKLEVKLLADYDSLEIMHWGINGWSTLDEFNFFKEHGKDFEVDLLIIGWVSNDPDVGRMKQVEPGDPAKEYPLLNKILPPLAQSLINHKRDNDYDKWEKELYTQKNLKEYQKVLKDFSNYLALQHTPSLYVLTPCNFEKEEEKEFAMVRPIIAAAGFPCLDIFPSGKERFKQYSAMELRANPVNAHPGDSLTEFFANEVKAYLERNNYLKSVPAKQKYQ